MVKKHVMKVVSEHDLKHMERRANYLVYIGVLILVPGFFAGIFFHLPVRFLPMVMLGLIPFAMGSGILGAVDTIKKSLTATGS